MSQMMTIHATLSDSSLDLKDPTVLFQDAGHAVYWLGITNETAFRCNAYLIVDGDEHIIVDPGSRTFFPQVKSRVAQVCEPEHVTGIILCHQDPDVSASMVDWLDVNPCMQVISTPRTHVLLPHYGKENYVAYDVTDNSLYPLPSGKSLRFIEAPFLHFPGAFTTYDETSSYLFSGDIWAALDINWRLIVDSFDDHISMMDLFHTDYMASNVAARGFVDKISHLDVRAILPQHGSIIPARHVKAAFDYLRHLRCGTDLVYPNLTA